MEYHVSKSGSDRNEGSKDSPFLTISQAARVAMEYDSITVHEGIYREWVKPANGAMEDCGRIIYQAAKGEKVEIKGSEVINDWELVENGVWKVVLSNTFFGMYNPYVERVEGDWCFRPVDWKVHTGDVYLNGQSFYEVNEYEQLTQYIERENVGKEESLYQWYTVVNEADTVIYANFQEKNPNQECVEINVRKCCFFPDRTGLDYITVRGFEFSQAATLWAPPTGEQIGMVGPNWSKGWIIEDNCIHDSKCSGISIGKDKASGDQLMHKRKDKAGYHYQLESVFTALQMGWSKDRIGSHIIRRNEIYNCGQTGIVGHLGCVFSEIYGNHIYQIGLKKEFGGFEIAGIKLHAAIDVQLYENCIHDCTLGFWMDWQAQGTRISRNSFFDNVQDGFIEVTHGPMVVDNNIFASKYSLLNQAQGTAYINNIFNGYQFMRIAKDRSTPYHYPHSTAVKGCTWVYMGDDRYYNNIFVGGEEELGENSFYGMCGYDRYMASWEEYIEEIRSNPVGHQKYFGTEQPVYINNNVYYNKAKGFHRELKKLELEKDCKIRVKRETDGYYVEFEIDAQGYLEGKVHSTETLGRVRLADAVYDKPDGSLLKVEYDYQGKKRGEKSSVGPFSDAKVGENHYCIWKFENI